MEIRFPCPLCKQPIEIDPEWASRAVACPYCRKTVTAPAESTLGPIDDIPIASPMGHSAVAPQALPDASHRGYSGTNRIALVAMILSMLMVLSLVSYLTVIIGHHDEMFDKAAMQGGFSDSFDSSLKAAEKIIQDNGGVPPAWMFIMQASQFVGLLLWVASLICGIVGVTRKPRRHLAVSALIAVTATPITLCAGIFYIAAS